MRPLRTSILLSLLFLAVYGATNHLASLHASIPSIAFGFERHTPFLPALIVPYMSIDLFFIAAPFLCRTDTHRRTLARRITLAILAAGACFLIFPLRFSFDRPPVTGWLGAIFNAFRQLDQPFNQCPSLHITLTCILLPVYWRACHARPILKSLLLAWFTLIFLSPIFTWQHHLLDILGGLLLAAVCFHFIQDEPLIQPITPNRRVGIAYALGAVIAMSVASIAGPLAPLFWCIAFALFAAACMYGYVGPGVYRKGAGKLPLTTHLLLWPLTLGQRLSLVHYRRTCHPHDPLTDHLWLGRVLSAREAQQAIDQGITAILDLTCEFSAPKPFRDHPHYRNIPILDLTAPTPRQIAEALTFLAAQTARPNALVYLHCKIGFSRTAAIAGAWLLHTRRADTAAEAIAQLRAARPGIVIRPEVIALLQVLQPSPASAATGMSNREAALAGAPDFSTPKA